MASFVWNTSSFFENGYTYTNPPPATAASLDITRIIESRLKKSWEDWTKQYTFNTDKLFKSVTIKYSPEISETFGDIGEKMEFGGANSAGAFVAADNLSEAQTIEYTIPFSADIDLMLIAPEKFSQDGIAVMATIKEASPPTPYESNIPHIVMVADGGGLSLEYVQNAPLTLLNLRSQWYGWAMPSEKYIISGDPAQTVYDTYSLVKNIEHTYRVALEDDLDLSSFITSSLTKGRGFVGIINKATVRLTTRMTEIEILYPMDCLDNYELWFESVGKKNKPANKPRTNKTKNKKL